MPDWIKRKDVDLRTQSAAFTQGVNGDPAGYGIDPLTAAELTGRQAAFAAALQRASDAGTNSTTAVCEKDACRASLVALMREIARVIRSRPGITTEQLLGVALRPPEQRRGRVSGPAAQPGVTIVRTEGRVVTVRVFDPESPTRLAKPRDTVAAAIFVHAGEQPPVDANGWTSRGMRSHTTFTLEFNEEDVPSGATVWVTAAWVGTRQQLGPPATPAYTHVAGRAMPKLRNMRAA